MFIFLLLKKEKNTITLTKINKTCIDYHSLLMMIPKH